MRIAIKHDTTVVDVDGRVAGHDAGATLVRRLLRVFDDSVLIGPGPRRCEGFDLIPLEFLDAEETVVINMDVVDSVHVWQQLRRNGSEPRIMNFLWWNPSDSQHRVEQSALALACALFPTFANSERTASEVRETVAQWTIPPLASQAKIAWVNLGFRLEHVRDRAQTRIPVVLYPAIYLSERKQPGLFLDVVERVRKRTPIQVEARLHESHLVSEQAMRMSLKDWIWVGPLTASRTGYWEALAHTTAFLATSRQESYGMEYVEALAAGAIGVLPDLPWARALVPEAYPFFYQGASQAEELLYRAVTEPDACRAELDAAAGGDFLNWLRERHDDDAFERAIAQRVHEWFGST